MKPKIVDILTKGSPEERELIIEECPYGRPGDRFWLRETWRLTSVRQYSGYEENRIVVDLEYKAGGHGLVNDLAEPVEIEQALRARAHGPVWRSGLFIPRWASRIDRELVEVRAERLQLINEKGVRAEGLQQCTQDGLLYKWGWEGLPWQEWFSEGAVAAYTGLWDKLNKPRGYPWANNDWVWVLVFKDFEE